MFEELAALLPDGWEVIDDALLMCPHGHQIEFDGQCPEGCESPLLKAGLI